MLETIYNRLSVLTKTTLDDECSITLFNDQSGMFDICYKSEIHWRQLRFFNFEFALEILDAIEKCNSVFELLELLEACNEYDRDYVDIKAGTNVS